MLDDYFSSAEFLASREAGAAFDGTFISPLPTPSTPMGGGHPHFFTSTPSTPSAGGPSEFIMSTPLADSGVGLNYMSANSPHDADDEVFAEANGK